MGKNKQQVATEARAKKSAVGKEPGQISGDTGKVNEQPKPEAAKPATQTATPAPAQPATPSKQTQSIEKLTVAFREQRQIEVKPSMLTADGKYINLLIGKEWPVIQIGASGGIVLPAIKSYPKAFQAALEGDKLLAKQTEREQKKVTATAAPAPTTAQAPAAEKQLQTA